MPTNNQTLRGMAKALRGPYKLSNIAAAKRAASGRPASYNASLPVGTVGRPWQSVAPVPTYAAGQWKPDALGPKLKAWYDAGGGTNMIKDASNRVSQLTDLSGNGRHYLQPNVANQPVYFHDGNGFTRGGVRGNGAAFYMTRVETTVPVEFYAMICHAGGNIWQTWLGGKKQAGTGYGADRLYVRADDSNYNAHLSLIDDSGFNNEAQVFNIQQVRMWEGRLNADGTIDYAKDVVNLATSAARATSVTQRSIVEQSLLAGYDSGVIGSYSSTEVTVLVECSDNLTLAERAKVQGYVAWQCGEQARLPAGHPYQNARP